MVRKGNRGKVNVKEAFKINKDDTDKNRML
jgi:hypothetical protein